jgi:hypothetical protein
MLTKKCGNTPGKCRQKNVGTLLKNVDKKNICNISKKVDEKILTKNVLANF